MSAEEFRRLSKAPVDVRPPPKGKAQFALGRLPAGTQNGTEARYEADVLRPQLMAGEIAWYAFEALKLRLADNTFYTPDYAVMRADGGLECHEVKGHWEDDARVKIKVAARLFPLVFIAVKPLPKKQGGGWETERF